MQIKLLKKFNNHCSLKIPEFQIKIHKIQLEILNNKLNNKE